ncbi:14561_t:CDS:2, partial [Acaulospora colombiana]
LVPLKPDCKGPFWETTLGYPHVASWSRFCVRVLNDVPIMSATKGPEGASASAIPDRLLQPSHEAPSSTSGVKKGSTSGQSASGTSGKPILPDHLVAKMAGMVLEAPSGTTQVLLIDKVHQVLKGEGAKKNAVEATLKQVFEKLKGEKRWAIKEEYRNIINNS